ncbi:superoxide dismutase [Candidatus Woesearchaeota archaeon CG10_big_fil_rev_8_21_14_0_10_37_12]|nr:MAG: superoxide dismutase [Candidatus Woesearchaeota archaeon CG10_big_fil_rev_8_21_14_0_10_37_12]
MELTKKDLKYKELPGFLSEKQLFEHESLYAGYVKKTNTIRSALKNVDRSAANATFSDIRELKVEETFAVNGVKLHEGYFWNMIADGKEASGTIADWIAVDFGSVDAWKEDLLACALSARGWVVLSFDLDTGKLHNIVCDLHNQGGIWNSVALLVLDVYEHAYFVDYATGRKKYVDGFLQHIDWDEVNNRIKTFDLAKFRK